MRRFDDLQVITALKTPYTKEGAIDFYAWHELLEYQLSCGVRGFVVGGTTGEGHLMRWPDQLDLISQAVKQVGDRGLIIGNTGSNNTREAVRATREGFELGMAAALQVNPYYGRTSVVGLMEHFTQVLAIGPAILYNVPLRTGQDIPADVVANLSRHKNFVGMKECCGIERIRMHSNAGVRAWSGNDSDFRAAMRSAGATGVISVVSNLIPNRVRHLAASVLDREDAAYDALVDWLNAEPNPIGIGTALAMIGACQPVFRLPYAPLDLSLRQLGAAIMEQVADDRMQKNGIRILRDDAFLTMC